MALLTRLMTAAAAVVLLLSVLAAPTAAASPDPSPAATPAPVRLGLGVGPTTLVFPAPDPVPDPDVRMAMFRVVSSADVAMKVAVSTTDFSYDASGKRQPSAEPLPGGAASWTALSPTSFELAPRATQDVAVTVTVPRDAQPGDHVAMVGVLGTTTDEEWARIQAESPGGSLVRSQVFSTVDLIVRVPGEIHYDLAAAATASGTDLGLPAFTATLGEAVLLEPKITNNSNVAVIWDPSRADLTSYEDLVTVVPTLRLTNKLGFFGGDSLLFDGKVNEDGSVNVSVVTVMPGATKTLHLTLPDPPLLGLYDYTFMLPGEQAAAAGTTPDLRPTVTATGTVTIVNTQKVLLWIVLPIVVILLLIVAFFVWRRLRKSRARRAETRKQEEIARAREEGRREAMAAQGATATQAAAAGTAATATPMNDAELQAAVAAEEARQSQENVTNT